MSILNRKLRRDLWQSRGMLSAIAAIVAVGVGCLVGFQATYWDLEYSKSTYYQKSFMADFWVDLKKAPLTEAVQVASIPGVARLRTRIVAPAIVDLPGVDRPVSGRLISLPNQQGDVINDVVIMSGTYFTSDGRGEVLVNLDFARARDISPGDSLTMVVEGQQKTLRVVGLAISSEYVYLMPPGSIAPAPADFGVFYVTRKQAEDIMGFQGATNNLVGHFTPQARQNPDPVLKKIEELLKPYGVFTTTALANQESNLALNSELAGLSSMATVLPLVFLTVSAMVLNVLMTRLALGQRTIVGVLKALGYSNAQLRSHFLMMGVLTGIIGGILGVGLGYLIARGMIEVYKGFFTFPEMQCHFYPGMSFFAILLAAAFGLLGSLRGVNSVIHFSPAEAMRESPPVQGGAVFLEKWRAFWSRLGFRWQTVLRNIIRNKTRSLAGLFAAAMGTALLIATFGMVDSLKYMVLFQFDNVRHADYTLNFRTEVGEDAVSEIEAIPGIVKTEPELQVACTFTNENHSKKGTITGLLPHTTLLTPSDIDGEPLRIPPTGLLMTRRLAEKLHLKVGDLVTVTPIKGRQHPFEAPITGLTGSLFGLAVYADIDYLSRRVEQDKVLTKVDIKADMSPAQKRDFLHEIKKYSVLQSYGDIGQQKEQLQFSFVDKFGSMAYPMILFGAVIFFGSILNSSLISLMERKREIASYRVLGYTPLEISNMILRENTLVNSLGILAGLPLGYLLTYGMSLEFTNDLYSMPCIITSGSWMEAIFLGIFFVLLSQGVIIRSIQTMNWQEALSMKE